jgi:hypothetical protein
MQMRNLSRGLFPSRHRWFFGVVAALAFWQLGVGAVQANEIDKNLKSEIQGKLIKEVVAGKYKNVGVLPFEVQLADKKPSFHRGDLNKLMATRLGNMLIIGNNLKDAKNAIGVVPDAGAQAAKIDKKSTWTTPEARAKLFTHNYTLPWEVVPGKANAPVKIDAFVTGVVKVPTGVVKLPKDDKKVTTVTVLLFDKTSKEPRTIGEFQVPTETSTLTDMHLAYKVEIRDLKDISKREVDIVEGPGAEDKDPNKKPKPTTAPYSEFLDFKVFYDDREVDIANGKLPNPDAGQKIHFKMTGKERLAVVILVNGVNTVSKEQDREPEKYSRWILEANKTYGVYGFYNEGKVDYFVATKKEEAQEGAFVPSQAYKITIIVFKSVGNNDSDLAKVDLAHLRTQTTSASSATGGKPGIRDLTKQILAGPKQKARNLIMGGQSGDQVLETDTFNGVIVANGELYYGKTQPDEN